MNIYFNKKIDKKLLILVVTLVLILITLSLGRTARWDLLQQIAMIDRFSLLGSLYPSQAITIPTEVSSYFPGVAYIALIVKNIVSNNLLIYSMHLIAVIVVLSFFMVQRRITYSINKDLNLNNFFIWIIIFTLVFGKHYLLYALEFKPDTIAFLFGSLGIILAKADDNTSIKIIPYVMGAILTGCALVFKQQYIAFLVGMIFYSLISKNSKFQKFTVLSLLFSFLILFILYKQENVFFWTITLFADDGFITIHEWIMAHAKFTIIIGQLIIILYGANIFGFINIEPLSKNISRKVLFATPWPTLLFLSSLAAFAGSFKFGGNQGNSEFGLILLFPLFYFLIHKLDKKILIIISWVVVVGTTPSLYKSVNHIKNSTDLHYAASSLLSNNNSKVLTGSNVYGSVRRVNTLVPIHGLYTYQYHRHDQEALNVLPRLLANQNYDFVILDNYQYNLEPLIDSTFYSIYFKNDIGIIATRN